MKTIDTPTVRISVLDEQVVLVEARHGVNIDAAESRRDSEAMSAAMPGDYGMIIDRKEDYSIVPAHVYAVLNSNPRLKAIAIVVHREMTMVTAPGERPFFRGAFKVFLRVEDAQAWIKSVLQS